jgi:proteic killer suppression protein
VIKSVASAATRRILETGKAKFSGLDVALARKRLVQIASATSLREFEALNSVGLHKLKGDLRGFWSVDVNGPWPIIFKFRAGDAYEVEIIDTH